MWRGTFVKPWEWRADSTTAAPASTFVISRSQVRILSPAPAIDELAVTATEVSRAVMAI
jgi:hypothetical protein